MSDLFGSTPIRWPLDAHALVFNADGSAEWIVLHNGTWLFESADVTCPPWHDRNTIMLPGATSSNPRGGR